MNAFERWKAAWEYRRADRLPVSTMGGWEPETYNRWMKEGLPPDWQATDFFHEDGPAGTGVALGTNGTSPFWPRFEVQVLEKGDGYRIERDEFGKVVRRIDAWQGKGLAHSIEWPVKTRDDWERLKRERMDPADDSRYTALEQACQVDANGPRTRAVLQNICGTYRMLWHCFGDENLCYALCEDPDWVHDIMRTWLKLQTTAIDRIVDRVPINVLTILEDMSYRSGMMVSPAHFREFMMPYYKELIGHVRRHPALFGIWVDSDGNVEELIPLLIEAGVTGMFPFEVQAGMDATAIRRQYGQQFVIRGGIDKKALVSDRAAIDRELERVLPIFVETGGYFISLDHSAPPDIPFDNYQYFMEQAKTYR